MSNPRKRLTPGTPEHAKRLEWRREWRRRNKDSVRQSKAKYEAANPEQKAKWQRTYILKKKYGLTLKEYAAWEKRQAGKCAIYGTTEALHVDHCHDSGRLRGLLCGRCNRGLGMFDDSPERLRQAALYLSP